MEKIWKDLNAYSTNGAAHMAPMISRQTDATLSIRALNQAETSAEVESTNRERIFKTAYGFNSQIIKE